MRVVGQQEKSSRRYPGVPGHEQGVGGRWTKRFVIGDSKRSRTVEGEFNEGQNRMGSTSLIV